MKTTPTSLPATPSSSGFARRDFIKLSAGALIGSQFLGLVTRESRAGQLPSQKNIILIITDQERTPTWWPAGWEDANLPNTKRLKDFGLTFTHAFTASAMCTVSRTTMFTGLFPAQHHSPWTLTEGFQQSLSEHQLDPTLPNLATCLKQAGYDVIYKGKWHMSSPAQAVDGSEIWDDISRYGFDGWDAPDAGGDTAVNHFGGADATNTVKNDQRFIDDTVTFLTDRVNNPTSKPFCLIVSLVNPHDVLSYPNQYGPTTQGSYYQAGDPWITATTPAIQLPPTISEDLANNNKPSSQFAILESMAVGLGPLLTQQKQLNYLNFYGRLMMAVDKQIGQVLDVLDPDGDGTGTALNDALIIRTSDHGEMALAHDGLRQKAFIAYEEALHVPLIWSNPGMFPTAMTTDAMVSHVDLLPTLCALTGVPNWQSLGFKGIEYSQQLLQPGVNTSPTAVQPYILFTFDDIYAGQNEAQTGASGVVNPPNRIQLVRTGDYKLARYWDGSGAQPPAPDQGEFYDLRPTGGDYYANDGASGSVVYNAAGPLELINLSDVGFTPPTLTSDQQAAYANLQAILQQETTGPSGRLVGTPLNAAAAPKNLKIQIVPYTPSGQPATVAVQISFDSAENTSYQVQKSTDLINWTAAGAAMIGNNGLMLYNDTMADPQAYYRLQWSAVS
ncbi:MAG TPA: sulfatase-like hydrolase/transferase [Verrucomicrobiae bacterium]|jgi:arylsulfatase A-like enzyme